MAYSTIPLSASTNGEPIEVTGTTTGASVLIHTAPASGYDEVKIFANNTSAADVNVTLEVAGTAQTNLIVRTIPAKTTKFVFEGSYLDGAKTVRAFATAANVVNLYGKVGRTS
jgi:hypothetical protein